MGQSTFGIIYGIRQEPPDNFEEGWHDLIDEYEKDRPSVPTGKDTFDFLGYWVAVGGSGKDGAASLHDAPFALLEFPVTPEYQEFCISAQAKWEAFAQWALTKNIKFPLARLYLVETETA